MLGKQWLNRYASTDMRGTAIERSQNRQRKLDGIIAWYFDHVMESLPLMLQVALLLLGCSLSHYLWEINITVASVVIGVTLFGIIFYIFIVAAGAASERCPYQTPGSNALRYLRPKVHRLLHPATSVVRNAFWGSETVKTITRSVKQYLTRWSRDNIKPFLMDMVLQIPCALAIDTYHLGRAIFWLLATLPVGVCRLGSMVVILLVYPAHKVHNQLRGASSTPEQGLDLHITALDFHCISWMLQTSLDKTIHLAALKHLATTKTLAGFYPTLIADCFDVFISCVKGGSANREVVIVQGLEQLATVSALCLFNISTHLLATDPTSSVLEDARLRCLKVFSAQTNFHGQYHTMSAVCCLLITQGERWRGRSLCSWRNYKPSTHEYDMVAHGLVRVARFNYQTTQKVKVPRWILHFAFNSLSLQPPISIVVNCLSIIMIDLGCEVPDDRTMALNKG